LKAFSSADQARASQSEVICLIKHVNREGSALGSRRALNERNKNSLIPRKGPGMVSIIAKD